MGLASRSEGTEVAERNEIAVWPSSSLSAFPRHPKSELLWRESCGVARYSGQRGASKGGVACRGFSDWHSLASAGLCVPSCSALLLSGKAAFEQAAGADAVNRMRLSLVSSRRAAQQHRWA